MQVSYPIQCSSESYDALAKLLAAMEQLFSLRFEHRGETKQSSIVLFCDSSAGLRSKEIRFSAPPQTPDEPDEVRLTEVQFSSHSTVPFPFRGRSLSIHLPKRFSSISLTPNDRSLASTPAGPIWACDEAGESFHSSLPLPSLAGTGKRTLLDVFCGSRFLELLPLIVWLRQRSSNYAQFRPPPLRACFIFDDPNLHWETYGFVNYRQLARDAEKENYHISFATIPLDTWFSYQPAVQCFKQNANRLSLAFHGNNHLKQELARGYTKTQRIFLLNQALKRIARLENRTGLNVDRVMIPPHGACSEEMLSDLPNCGFKAACISHGSLKAYNRNKEWVQTLGYFPSEIISDCTVFPRWAFSANPINTILLAAFLHQPMIFRGHHNDLKDGIEILREHARVINSLGSVQWDPLAKIGGSAYESYLDGTTLRLKLWSSSVIIDPPQGITHLQVETPFSAPVRFRQKKDTVEFVLNGASVPISPGDRSLLCLDLQSPENLVVTPTLPSPWPLLRRLLAETRDRLA
jgi:hypothetical protein